MFEFDEHFANTDTEWPSSSSANSTDQDNQGPWHYLGNQVWTLAPAGLQKDDGSESKDWVLISSFQSE